jgi:PBSX family phage terminase large subunit
LSGTVTTTAPPERPLSDKQLRSIAQSTARINIWEGAVSSGKTIASLGRWLTYVGKAPRGGELVVSGKTVNTVARNVFGPLSDPSLFGRAAHHVSYTRGAPTAKILGRTIEVITANDARAEGRIRGLTSAGWYVDEATLLPKEFWVQLLARLRVPGAKLFATTNPDGPNHWLRQEFLLREHDLNLRRWHFTLEDNPFLDPAYVADLKREYVGLWYRRFIEGQWCLAEGAVYDMYSLERHVIDVLPPIREWLALGIDYGTTNPFAGLILALGTDGVLYLTHEWWWNSKVQRRQLTDVEYSQAIREWMDGLPVPRTDLRGVRPRYVVVDPSAASFVAQCWQDGLSPTQGDNSVLDGIRTVSSLLARDRLKIHRSCVNLLNELPGYSWSEEAAAKGEDAPIKVDDHGCDAMRYAVHTTETLWRPALREAA